MRDRSRANLLEAGDISFSLLRRREQPGRTFFIHRLVRDLLALAYKFSLAVSNRFARASFVYLLISRFLYTMSSLSPILRKVSLLNFLSVHYYNNISVFFFYYPINRIEETTGSIKLLMKLDDFLFYTPI